MLPAFCRGIYRSFTAFLLVISHSVVPLAQTRNDSRPVPVSAGTSSGVCTLQRSVALLPENADATPDARYPLGLVSTATGALIAYRTAADNVYIIRVDDGLGRVARDRVVTGPVASFSLASAPGGAALLSAERDAQDGRDEREVLLLARLDTAGNARNIPRALSRVLHCDGVAIVATATGFLTAWGTTSGPSTTTMTLDARGVPNAAARIVVDGSAPTLIALTGATRFAMTTINAGTPNASVSSPVASGATALGPTLSHLDESGAAVEGWPLSASPRTVVTLPSVALVFGVNSDSFSITRWWPGNSPTEFTANAMRAVVNDTRVMQAISERNSAIVLVDNGNASEQFVRVQPDGTSTLLASRTGTHGALAPSLDGSSEGASFLSAAHTIGHAGVELQRWICPRTSLAPTVPVSPVTPSVPDAGAAVVSPTPAP